MSPGARVVVRGRPYAGESGVVVNPPNATSATVWDVWVLLDEQGGGPKGFDAHEVEVLTEQPSSRTQPKEHHQP